MVKVKSDRCGDHDTLIQAYAEALNSDIPERWLACFSEDVEYVDVALGMVAHGRTELDPKVNGWFTAFTDHRIDTGIRLEDGGRTAFNWTLSATVQGRFEGVCGDPVLGSRFTLQGANFLQFDPDGKVCWLQTYWDLASLSRQLGVWQLSQ